MAGNGKFAGSPDWGTPNATDPAAQQVQDQFAELATKKDVQMFVVNAFKTWHEPYVGQLMKNMSVLEHLLLFLQEKGLEVPEQRLAVTQQDIEAGFVTVPVSRVLLTPAAMTAWAEEKQAAAVAAATPKDQQS